ncbi:MAG: hypothetical protein F6K54_31740 [Okeania sp. SIO3B5]|uniref:hypothetical protein n=1 Tax=Okeania sp. SIO3B5 TaxID=2607811 RepID=UPI0014008021|nr:hypothetical protein [Okeania sp. SIO3B5]NEO57239.1 hypothetical protein [Okeania sp. SIO3B5]
MAKRAAGHPVLKARRVRRGTETAKREAHTIALASVWEYVTKSVPLLGYSILESGTLMKSEVRSQKSEVRSYFCKGDFEQLSKNISP